MFFKPTFVITALATLAVATPTRRGNSCSTGTLQCCNSVQDAKSASLNTIFALLGIVVDNVTGLVGVTCSPITVVGAGGTSCTSQAVCCDNNTFNGIIALGCTPVNINV